jgi:hypothetical protein
LIITIVFMNFYIELARVTLAPYPLYRPPKEQPIMKRQLLLSLTLSILAANAFALPAAEQATPQVKASTSVFTQTLAADGGDRTPQGQTLASDGSDRTPQGQTLASDGSDRTPQGQTLASDGSGRTPQGQTLAEDGFDRTPLGQAVAEGGRDRLEEKGLV